MFSGVTKVESPTLPPGDHSPALDLGTGGQESRQPLRLLGPCGSKTENKGLSHQETSREWRAGQEHSKTS